MPRDRALQKDAYLLTISRSRPHERPSPTRRPARAWGFGNLKPEHDSSNGLNSGSVKTLTQLVEYVVKLIVRISSFHCPLIGSDIEGLVATI